MSEFTNLTSMSDYEVWGISTNSGTPLQIVGLANNADGTARSWTVTTGNQSPVLVPVDAKAPQVFMITLEDAGFVLTGPNPTATGTSHYVPGGLPVYITLLPGERISVFDTTLYISKCR